MLLQKGKVYCAYDDLTMDTIRNRYVRAALEKLCTLKGINKKLEWQVDNASDNILNILPNMYADIAIENKKDNKRIIIDTKSNSLTISGYYRDATLRNTYLYQIYAYLRSQEKEDDRASLSSIGMLLHPSINEYICEWVTIQNHPIYFCTVNLQRTPQEIKTQLLDLLHKAVENDTLTVTA